MKNIEKKVVLELKDIKKNFGETVVLKGVSLAIEEGEFVTFLGSSGCGKTTILRIIAGLEYPDSGSVLIEEKDMEKLGPEKRNVNMVFQNYALFPHMNVEQNIGYGLKIKGVAKDEIKHRVKEMLKLVQLEGFEARRPSAMSGGQRQRVAIARALINNPKVLLLDEPLGALDLQLRRQMQMELKHLQKELGITFVYITHDQEEAINMSDRIVILNNGYIEQVGTPEEIYNDPETAYVASFVGSANILRGTVEQICEGGVVLKNAFGAMNARFRRGTTDTTRFLEAIDGDENLKTCVEEKNRSQKTDIKPGTSLTLAVRSENIEISREPKSSVYIEGMVAEKNFAGGMLRIAVKVADGSDIVISRHGINIDYAIGEHVYMEWPAEAAVIVAESLETEYTGVTKMGAGNSEYKTNTEAN